LRTCSIESLLARPPTSARAGSPGLAKTSRNVIADTPINTIPVQIRR
jgi:hypothetical protein